MERRKPSRFEGLVERAGTLPWWMGVVLAIAVYFGLHSIVASEGASVWQPDMTNPFASQNIFIMLAAVGQYLLPLVFLLAAGVSAYGHYKRQALHDRVVGSPDRRALSNVSWRQFEALVSEAFRRRGYSVRATGSGMPDGAVDLTLKKDGQTYLVQCKQWRAARVGVNSPRELYDVIASRSAAGGFVLTSGIFTDEARAFVRGKNIELIDGKALLALIGGVRAPVKFFRDPLSINTTGAPFCPECQSRMVMRKAKHGLNAGKDYWRCARHPDCKGTRPA
ncbi:MAG: restriction endonuclease [Gammaproteobacteria bacterium]